jgi:hypothetical protein
MAGESFFTMDTFGTAVGCSGAIVILTNTFRTLTRRTSPLIPFIFALIIGFLVAGVFAGKLHSAFDWLLAFLNSCLLFTMATGGQETIVSAGRAQGPGGVTQQAAGPVHFFSSWLRPD